MEPYQIVIDTNVFLSALQSNRGASFKLLSLIEQTKRFQTNVSVPLILEYEDVAIRQQHRTGLSAHELDVILDYLCSAANRWPIFYLWRPYLNDPKDEMLLELAVQARCHAKITYNKRDFREVDRFGLRVLTPREFLTEIGEI